MFKPLVDNHRVLKRFGLPLTPARSLASIINPNTGFNILGITDPIEQLCEVSRGSIDTNRVITILTTAANKSEYLVGREDLCSYLLPLVASDHQNAVAARVTAASLIGKLVKRGVWKSNRALVQTITALLSASLTDLRDSHGVFVARAVRALTVLPEDASTESLLRALLTEARRRERIVSYSAMDISEISHSLDSIKSTVAPDFEALIRVDELICKLFLELLDRRDNLRIQINRRSRRDDQWLSIQAASNILYTSRGLESDTELRRDIIRLILELCWRHSDTDAIKSCQPVHLLSIMESTMSASPHVQYGELQTFKKLIDELIRKKQFIDDSTRVRTLLDEVGTRWSSCAHPARTFILKARSEFS